ncbi:MAG: hypothetical protein JWM36_3891 [Hyphomicrobiales bacterium]|nr:hypothetical protein [Hyphomicrobiales bacterium]
MALRDVQVSALETFVNLAVKLVPTDETTAMITTAMRPAISPYSIAVAPDSLVKKLEISERMRRSFSFKRAGRTCTPEHSVKSTRRVCLSFDPNMLTGPPTWADSKKPQQHSETAEASSLPG